jgi:hypothetical protein
MARPCSRALAAWFRPPQCTSLCPRALGYYSPLAHFETLTHPVPAQHLFLAPAPQHREHAPVGSLRQPSRATMPLRLPLFLDSLRVLDAGILASDSLCPSLCRFTTPTDQPHPSRLGFAPRSNSHHAQSSSDLPRAEHAAFCYRLPSASASHPRTTSHARFPMVWPRSHAAAARFRQLPLASLSPCATFPPSLT